MLPNRFMLRLSAAEMSTTTMLRVKSIWAGEMGRLIVMGLSYGYLALESGKGGIVLTQTAYEGANKGNAEVAVRTASALRATCLQVGITLEWDCQFLYSADGVS